MLFQNLNLDKKIYLTEPDETISYREVFTKLASEIGLDNRELNMLELGNKVVASCGRYFTALATGRLDAREKEDLEAKHIVEAFFNNSVTYHNRRLAKAPSGWPNTPNFDIRFPLSKMNYLTFDELCFRLLVGVINAWKIEDCENEENRKSISDYLPAPDFLLILKSIKEKGLNLTEKCRDHLAIYDSVSLFASAQRNLESRMSSIITDSKLLALLCNRPHEIFDFQSIPNVESGCNGINLIKAMETVPELVKRYTDKQYLVSIKASMEAEDFEAWLSFTYKGILAAELQKIGTAANQAILDTIRDFNEVVATGKTTQLARQEAYCDASRWIFKLLLVVHTAEQIDPKQRDLGNWKKLLQNDLVSEIYTKGCKGDFPTKARNERIEGTEPFKMLHGPEHPSLKKNQKMSTLL